MNIIKKYKHIVMSISIVSIIIISLVINLSTGEASIISDYGQVSHDALSVSIINLIATPEQYNGKLVRVIGIGIVEFESNGLFLSKDDYEKVITKNAVWLTIDEEVLGTTYENLQKLNGKYVLVEGTFNSKKNGHFGMFSGTIENIKRYASWD